MNFAGESLSRRNPKVIQDTVFYSIYPDDIASSTSHSTATAASLSLLVRLNSLITPLISTYIWQHEPFLLSTATSSSCRLCESSSMPHLHGRTRFGDNMEDEWFIVFLLFEISRAFPSLSIRVWDSDGEFLLIEAAYSLPRWLNPDSSPNRVFIRAGDLHIVSKSISTSTPSLFFSLEALRNPEIDTKASDSVQSVLKKKISGYPEKARANMHRDIVTVPLQVAQVLRHEPCLISLAVEGFYDRDVDSMKDASRMEKFLRSEKENGEIEMVRVSVKMSRAMHAQLVLQRFQAPSCYPMPGREEGPLAYKEAELGMKIACGFEMMYQERKRTGKEGKGSTWEIFRKSLERSGYFDGMLPGSNEYQRIMDKALEYYRSSALFSRTRDIMAAPVKMIDEILSSVCSINDFNDMPLLPPDDDSWLYNGEDELNSAILERQNEMEAYELIHGTDKTIRDHVTSTSSQSNDFNLKDVAESMQAFVKRVSSFEGAEVPYDWSKEVKLDAELFQKEMESFIGPVLQEGNSWKADLELNSSSDMDFVEEALGGDEICAWNEMRLHPLLIRSIRRLGFTKPTPIQKACIPVAAHHGKDIIGAAQTGSGKTLAFGLPILQRLLEEREKARRLLQNDTEVTGDFGNSHLRALILVPTRELALQVSDHLKKAAKGINVRVVSIVGGMYLEKQERLLRRRPEIVVGTPGRLWELMSGGNEHLVELHSLSFFVLDEADRMIENGHFNELQSIIDMLPTVNSTIEQTFEANKTHKTIPNLPRKKRQTFVFSATVALSDNFRKKLRRTSSTTKSAMTYELNSIEKLSERAGMRPDVAIIDLTNTSIVADKLVESFIECGEEEKEAYLYYILSIHHKGRTIVFCTSIAALRRISALLHLLEVNSWTLHAQMQQRARLKAMDRFRDNENGVLIATDVAARGLDIPGIRTVVHYQLPHSAEVYIHRSGRTARASFDGCSIALISPSDKAKFSSLCKSLSKETLQEFRIDYAYMPEVLKRISLARQIDKIQRKISQESAEKSWFERNAADVELTVDDTDSEEEVGRDHKQKKTSSLHLNKLQQGLLALLSKPLQPKVFSHRFLAGNGVSPLVQQQLEELYKAKLAEKMGSQKKARGLVVIGQDCVEPLQALRDSGREVYVNVDKKRESRRLIENLKSKRKEEKKRNREQKRKARKNAKQGVK